MSRYNNEDARKLVELEIQNRKEALKLYPEIIKVVEQFDGKVLNKRLETALKKVNERLCCKRGYSDFRIVFTMNRRYEMSSTGNTIYLRYFYLELNTWLETYRINKMEDSFLENERIRASVLIDSLLKGKEHMEKTIEQLQIGVYRADEWKARIEQLEKEICSVKKEIPGIIADYYGIN